MGSIEVRFRSEPDRSVANCRDDRIAVVAAQGIAFLTDGR